MQRAEQWIATSPQASHFVTITEVSSTSMHVKLRCDSNESTFVRSSERNGCVERFTRTLKEQLLWLTGLASVEELHAALQEFAGRFNNPWSLRRLGYNSPAQHRRSFFVEAA
jgi:hypothetical protein